jgi:PKD repeat protein
MTRITVALLFFLCSCQGATDFSEITPDQPHASFHVRISNNFSGLVRFSNASTGMKTYHWNFGFLTAERKPAESEIAHPIIFFPANGTYLVRLTAKTSQGEVFSYEKQVRITNFQ